MRRRRLLALVAAGPLVAVAMACSASDGRTLPPPAADQTTTTPSAPIVQSSTGPTDLFMLASDSFAVGAEIPERFTCSGDGISPALAWSGAPLDAASLALVARDRNAGGFVHWVVTGIDPFVQGVGEGGLPEGAVEGLNGAGSIGWLGPCPPAGTGTHTYEVAVLAFVDPIEIPAGSSADEAAAMLETAAIERAELVGTVTAG